MYQCRDTTTESPATTSAPQPKTSVLVLATLFANRPLLITTEGSSDNDLAFLYNGNRVHYSCSVIVNNEMYIYARYNINKVTNCQLEQVGRLPFQFDYGTCAGACQYG